MSETIQSTPEWHAMNGPTPSGETPWLLTEPPRPPWVARRPEAPWLVVATVCIGAFMGQLDASIVSLALPSLHTVFHASIGDVEWVSLSYLLVLISAVVAVGRLADMAGRKLLYTYGFGVFILGSAICGLAPSLPILLAARVVQAIGAAMLQANSVALIVGAVPPERLGRAIGIQGAAQAIGLAVGPAAGGLLIALGGWRLIFFVNVPAGLIGMALGWFLLPRSRHLQPRVSFDWLGVATIVPAVTCLLLAVSLGDELGWTSPLILTTAVGTVVLGILFLLREGHSEAPLVDLALFRSRGFSTGIVTGLLSYLILFGILFLVPFYLETKRGISTAEAGLLLTALPAAIGVAAPLAGRLADRGGKRLVTAGGMTLTAVALVLLALFRRPEMLLLGELALAGIGIGAFTPANNASIMSSAPRTHAGVSGGILNMTRGLGTSLGVALSGLVFTLVSGEAAHRSRLVENSHLTRGFAAAVFLLVVCAAGAALLSAVSHP